MIRLATYFLLGLTCALLIATCMGCTGLTQMSDDWCAAHPHAGPKHCWGQK